MENNIDSKIEELYLLQRAAQKINSILDLDVLLEEIVTDVASTFGYSRSGVLLKDDETNELVIAAVRGWTINFHMKGERFKIGEYGMVGHAAAIEETYYAPDTRLDPYYRISETSTLSELDIPLKVHGKLIGIFNFQHNETNAFSPPRIQLLEALAGHVATAIQNARLFSREREEKIRMAKELEEARNVQLSLFPQSSPAVKGYKFSGICIPCLEAGGDWFDYIQLKDGRTAVVIADVSGKGMGAALLMASTRAIIRMFAGIEDSPGSVLTNVNNILVKDFPRTKFVTAIFAVIDPSSDKIIFANAGHLPPVIAAADEAHFIKPEPGLPLGIMDHIYKDIEFDFPAGSHLLFYSDGITEAMNSVMDEFGSERLINRMKNPDAEIEDIINDVHEFTSNTPASDDMTLVMIKR